MAGDGDATQRLTARLADYILPAATQFEKAEATFFNFEFPHNVFHLRRALMPPPDGRLVSVVGADESEEFLRQNALIRSAWGERCVSVCETIPRRHHMDVLDELVLPAAGLHRAARNLLAL